MFHKNTGSMGINILMKHKWINNCNINWSQVKLVLLNIIIIQNQILSFQVTLLFLFREWIILCRLLKVSGIPLPWGFANISSKRWLNKAIIVFINGQYQAG